MTLRLQPLLTLNDSFMVDIYRRPSLILVISLILAIFLETNSLLFKVTIGVCQNEDCRKRFPVSSGEGGLFRMVRDIIPPPLLDENGESSENREILVESVGCIGKCGKGPNIAIQLDPPLRKSDSTSAGGVIYSGVTEAHVAAAALQEADIFPEGVPNLLLAAVDVMAKADRANTEAKKLKYLNSVIRALSNDPILSSSSAIIHALVLRADAKLSSDSSGALEDTRLALDIISSTKENNSSNKDPKLEGRVWRKMADAEESSGNVLGAIDALSEWAKVDPDFRTKAGAEIGRLREGVLRV